eukprot:PhM_4_TR12274/c0_g1_i1/m.105539
MNSLKVDLLNKIMTANRNHAINDKTYKKLNHYVLSYYVTGVRDEKALIKHVEKSLIDKRHQTNRNNIVHQPLPKVKFDKETKSIINKSEKEMMKTKKQRVFNKDISLVIYKKEKESDRENKNVRYTHIDGVKYRAICIRGKSDLVDDQIMLNVRYKHGSKAYKTIANSLDQSTDACVFLSAIPVYISVTYLDDEATNRKDAEQIDKLIDVVDDLAIFLTASTNHDFVTNRFVSNNIKIQGNDICNALTENEAFECCLNALLNCYASIRRFAMNRHILLSLLNKTENDIKDGVSINEMHIIFQHYNISAKIYNIYHKCIYCYQ